MVWSVLATCSVRMSSLPPCHKADGSNWRKTKRGFSSCQPGLCLPESASMAIYRLVTGLSNSWPPSFLRPPYSVGTCHFFDLSAGKSCHVLLLFWTLPLLGKAKSKRGKIYANVTHWAYYRALVHVQRCRSGEIPSPTEKPETPGNPNVTPKLLRNPCATPHAQSRQHSRLWEHSCIYLYCLALV